MEATPTLAELLMATALPDCARLVAPPVDPDEPVPGCAELLLELLLEAGWPTATLPLLDPA